MTYHQSHPLIKNRLAPSRRFPNDLAQKLCKVFFFFFVTSIGSTILSPGMKFLSRAAAASAGISHVKCLCSQIVDTFFGMLKHAETLESNSPKRCWQKPCMIEDYRGLSWCLLSDTMVNSSHGEGNPCTTLYNDHDHHDPTRIFRGRVSLLSKENSNCFLSWHMIHKSEASCVCIFQKRERERVCVCVCVYTYIHIQCIYNVLHDSAIRKHHSPKWLGRPAKLMSFAGNRLILPCVPTELLEVPLYPPVN